MKKLLMLVSCAVVAVIMVLATGCSTPLQRAAERGDAATVRTMLASEPPPASADVNMALVQAAYGSDNHEVARLLLDQGADPNARLYNTTAIAWAAMENHPRVVALLLERGADPNTKDNNGVTALAYACARGYTECARHLLSYGADPDVRVGLLGWTPRQQAIRFNHQEIIKLLNAVDSGGVPYAATSTPAATSGASATIPVAERINVLHAVQIDPATRAVTFIGSHDQRYKTGPIPYAALLKDVMASPYPDFSLDPTPQARSTAQRAFDMVGADLRRTDADPAYQAQWIQRFWTLLLTDSALADDRRRFVAHTAAQLGVTPEEVNTLLNKLAGQAGIADDEIIRIDGKIMKHIGYSQAAEVMMILANGSDSQALSAALGIQREVDKLIARYNAQELTQQQATAELFILIYVTIVRGLGVPESRIQACVLPVRQGRTPPDRLMKEMSDTCAELIAERLCSGFVLSQRFLAKLYRLPAVECRLTFQNVPSDSLLGDILFQADYKLKASAIGNAPPEFPGSTEFQFEYARRHNLAVSRDYRETSYTLVPEAVALQVSSAGDVVSFGRAAIRIQGRDVTPGRRPGDSAASHDACIQAYAQTLTDRFDALAVSMPEFHRLRETAKVIALVRWAKGRNVDLAVPAVEATKLRLPKVVPGFWECVMNADPKNTGVMLSLEGGASFGAHRGNGWVQASLDPQLDSLSPTRVSRKLDDQGNVTFWCKRCGAQLRYRSAPDGRPIEVEACDACARAAATGGGAVQTGAGIVSGSGAVRGDTSDRSSTGAAPPQTVADNPVARTAASGTAAMPPATLSKPAPTPRSPATSPNQPSAQETAESLASRAKLDALRVELYKALADHREIGRVCQEVVNHYSGTIASVDEITKRNQEALVALAADGVADSIQARSRVVQLSAMINDIKENIEGYAEVGNFASMDDCIDQSLKYLRQVSDSLDHYCKVLRIGLKGYDAWRDVFREIKWIQNQPELNIKLRALALDAEAVKLRLQRLRQEIEAARRELAQTARVPESSLPVTALRPPGLGAYVPKIYPTGESVQKIKAQLPAQ